MLKIEENSIENLIGKPNKNAGFTAPDNYFAPMRIAILSKLDIDNADSHKQAAGFIVPDAFFETQKNQILSKALQTKAKKIRLSFNQLMTRVATIAAMFTIAGFLFLQNNSGQSNDLTASISNEEIVNHLEIADVSEDLICELLDQNKMNKKENEIEKYLNENADEDLLMDNS